MTPGAGTKKIDPENKQQHHFLWYKDENSSQAKANGETVSSNLDRGSSHGKSSLKMRLYGGDFKRLAVFALGIFICYFYYGIIQERITRSKYGEEKEPFTYTQSLVFVQCVVNVAFAKAVMYWMGATSVDDTPVELYALSSFSYLAAMVSSNHALQFIPYPTQVLGKSCKPIPVMVLGVLFAMKRYPLRKYLFVLMIVLGVACFLYKDTKGTSASAFQFGWGEILLLFSLAMDGTTGAVQERIRARHSSKSHQMMFNMNMWSTLFLLIGLILTGEIVPFFIFVQKYPQILFDMVSFSVASALGQNFIFMTVTEFGPLPCSIITTTRKFFTILASVIFYQNPINSKQWIGILLVFTGLGLDSFYGKMGKTKPKN